MNGLEKISIGISIVSLIFVAVNIVVTIYMNNKKIKADLVSKARIEWIQETRILSADIIALTAQLQRFLNTYLVQIEAIENKVHKKGSSDNHEVLKKEAFETYDEFQKKMDTLFSKVYLFKLNLGKNEYNDKFVDKAQELLDMFIDESGLIKEQAEGTKTIEESLEQINNINVELAKVLLEYIDLSREYYKQEWEKAKLGK